MKKQVVLSIEESKYKKFLSLLETLDYVTITEQHEIPEWQKNEVSNRKKLIKKDVMKTRSWEEAENDIFK
ncbi:addiction module protein [Salibacter sp.]|uniref:addiction module protein n=1 Tax=Salibacter sp. TaxID=2010995 RepID=UPI0028709796|nr:addiction module protein [Salibacter sp.]MDR9399041.1 addiction module protein [Salibacter sp.]MDR9488094.1 addiction module protein [Salibacter sp.]